MCQSRIAIEYEGFAEQTLRLFTGRNHTDGGGAGLKAEHRDPLGITAEGSDVFFDPLQCRDLIEQPQVQGIRVSLPAGDL